MKRATLITILFATVAVYGCSSGDGDGAAGSGGSGTAGTGGSGTAGTGGSGTAGTGGSGTAGTGGSGTAGTGGSGTAGTGGSGTAGTGGSGTAGTGGSGTAGTGGSGTAGTGGSGTAGTGGSGTAGTGGSGTGGDGGVGGAGGAGGMAAEVLYQQDFDTLGLADAGALTNDGWLVFGNVFDGGGNSLNPYGPFGAPNGGQGFSALVELQGGPGRDPNQLSVYNDYGCCQPNLGHFAGTQLVESSVFQEPFPNTPGERISSAEIGKTFTFSFEAKRGNINSATDPKCISGGPDESVNPPCDSTALAYIQTLDPNASFDRTNFVEIDMTSIPDTWDNYSISLPLTDPLLEGQILQFGFRSVANAFEPSGIVYDNVLAELESP